MSDRGPPGAGAEGNRLDGVGRGASAAGAEGERLDRAGRGAPAADPVPGSAPGADPVPGSAAGADRVPGSAARADRVPGSAAGAEPDRLAASAGGGPADVSADVSAEVPPEVSPEVSAAVSPEVSPLPAATASLTALSAALATGDEGVIAGAMQAAAAAAQRVQVEEVLLQSYLFLGYPAALRALGLWRDGPGAGAAAQLAPDEERAHWHARGDVVCATVYGGAYERLRENVRRLHPDIERWMLEEGYGKVLGRPGLALRERELCIVALLAGLSAPHQLHSHLRGALNTGSSPADVEAVLALAAAVHPPVRLAAARALWAQVLERWQARPAD